jgi:hypothetical protein
MMLKVAKPNSITPAILILHLLFFGYFDAAAQLGPSSLNAPGVAFNADYLPASRYIRPEDSIKTHSTTATRRLSMGIGFNLSSWKDSSTGAFRNWSMAVSGNYMDLNNSKYENEIMPNELLAADISLLHMRNLRGKWSVMAMASVGVFTDLEKIDYKDIFINGGVLFIKQQNPRFTYGFGAALTNAFGTPMVLPGLYVQWNTGKKFKVEIVVPEKFSVSHRLNDFIETAVAVRLNGGSFDVEKHKDNRRLLGYKEMTAGWENSFYLSRLISVNIAAGATLLRSVDYRKKNLSEMFKTMPEHKLATGLFVSTGIRMHFKQ